MQMQELFKGYYSLTEEDLNELWKNAVFVFDTRPLAKVAECFTITNTLITG